MEKIIKTHWRVIHHNSIVSAAPDGLLLRKQGRKQRKEKKINPSAKGGRIC